MQEELSRAHAAGPEAEIASTIRRFVAVQANASVARLSRVFQTTGTTPSMGWRGPCTTDGMAA
jgi:hypothetical protein